MTSRDRDIRLLWCDPETEKWMSAHPDVETTVEQCAVCGLFYKDSLGHKCKKPTIYKGIRTSVNRYRCIYCNNIARKEEIPEVCPKCGRKVKEVRYDD